MKFFLTIVLVHFNLLAFTQNNSVELSKKSDVSNIVSLENGGFLLVTSEQYSKYESKINIAKISDNLEKLWSVDIGNDSKSTRSNITFSDNISFLIASKYSEFVYFIQEKSSKVDKMEYFINKIDASGKCKAYEITADFVSNNIIAIYVDEIGLHFVVNKKSEETKKETIPSEIEVYDWNHNSSDFVKNKTVIKKTLNDKDDNYIDYLGQNNNFLFFSKKVTDLSKNTINHEVLTIDKDGYIIIDKKNFTLKIKNELIAANNLRDQKGAYINDLDHDSYLVNAGPGKYRRVYYAKSGSFGCYELDVDNEIIYMYGYASNKKFVKSANIKQEKLERIASKRIIGGAYMYSFDLNSGNVIYKNEFSANKNVTDLSKSDFLTRYIWLDIINKDISRLSYGSDASFFRKKAMIQSSIINKDNTPEYVNRVFRYPSIARGVPHVRFLTNTLVTKSFVSQNAIDFIEANPLLRYNNYSIFGIMLNGKIVFTKNSSYTKTPKLEFTTFDYLE